MRYREAGPGAGLAAAESKPPTPPAEHVRKTARDLVADHLREAILHENLKEGQKLSVDEVAKRLEVSHTPTREAFQLLAKEGFVLINAYRGAYVAELSADEYEEIMLMRISLEGLAAELGTKAIDDDGIARMRELFEGLAAASKEGDIDGFIEVDRDFHAVHYRASGRETLWERIIGLRLTAERYTRRGYQTPGIAMKDTVVSHRRLLKTVEDRDPARSRSEITADLEKTFEKISADLRREERRTPREPQEAPQA